MPLPTSLTRRRLLGILAAGSAGSWLDSLLPRRAVARQQASEKPATNIADARKHPRTATSLPGKHPGKVARATRENATSNSAPDVAVVRTMLGNALVALAGTASVDDAWRTFVSPEDIVGLKVNPVAGKALTTSPEVVSVIIDQLTHAGIPRKNIVIWDRREFELHEVGFTADAFPGVRITGTERKDSNGSFYDKDGTLYSQKVIDRDWYYWADVEEKYDEETFPYMVNEGKHSYFTGICTKELTKIINVPVLKNAGPSVTLCMKNLAFGAITNTSRLHKQLLHDTCAEVPAFPPLRDKVVLNIVDGIKGCFQGGPAANPLFITAFNTILVGTDPVAVDRVGYEIILRKRLDEKIQTEENPKARTFMTMAEELGLGTADLRKIEVAQV